MIMKKLLFSFLTAVPLLFASCTSQYNAAYLLSGGMKAAQALSLSDEQIQAYVGQYVRQLDAYCRLLDIDDSNAKTVDALMKLELPSGVEVEIKV